MSQQADKSLSQWVLDTTLREFLTLGYQLSKSLAALAWQCLKTLVRLRPKHVRRWAQARRWELRFVGTSILVHMLVVVALQIGNSPLLGDSEDGFDSAENVEISVVTVSKDVEAVFDSQSEILVRAKKKTKKKSSRFDKLMRLLGNTAVAATPGRKSLSPEQLKRLLESSSIKEAHSLEKALLAGGAQQGLSPDILKRLESTRQDPLKNQKEIAKMQNLIQKQYPNFRGCYEKALLSDQDLQGRVGLYVKVNTPPSVKIQFRGQGTSQSKKKLIDCLKTKTRELSFPKASEGIAVKFNLVFMG